jgi:hypothetical protein
MATDVAIVTSTPDQGLGKPVDFTQVATGAGVVDRQAVSLADPITNTRAPVGVNGLQVDPSAVTSPVSVAALPLPAGAAADATMNTIATLLTQQVRLLRAISFQLSFLNSPRLDVLAMDPTVFDETVSPS